MKQLNDIDIFSFLQSGEAKQQEYAFRYLYRTYFGLVESLVLQNTGTKDDAADIFHDGLIVLFNNIKKGVFQSNSTIKTYLYSICRNLWLMKLRKSKREISLEEKHQSIQVQEDHFETLIVDERKEVLFRLLQELGDECKRILELFYFRKLKMNEIKLNLNMTSEQVVKNKKSRCMKSLRSIAKENTFYQQSLR